MMLLENNPAFASFSDKKKKCLMVCSKQNEIKKKYIITNIQNRIFNIIMIIMK